jgi:hypothetical protein
MISPILKKNSWEFIHLKLFYSSQNIQNLKAQDPTDQSLSFW